MYNKHYLTDVIFRVDFVSPEESIEKELSSIVKTACIEFFPILEPKTIETQELNVSAVPGQEKTVINTHKMQEWHFWGKEREKELVITHNCMFVNIKKYNTFDELKSQFFAVFGKLLAEYPNIVVNRIGLRYVDQINFIADKSKRKNWHSYWNKYIASPLVQGLSFPDEDSSIARCMSNIEMNYGEYMLRFQYGIYNVDHPAPNKKQVFILDTDVFSVGRYSYDDIINAIDTYHSKVKEWFEKAIKDPLRKKMGVITNDE
jgi:uncharacterized protein (TIGR04255 family)